LGSRVSKVQLSMVRMGNKVTIRIARFKLEPDDLHLLGGSKRIGLWAGRLYNEKKNELP